MMVFVVTSQTNNTKNANVIRSIIIMRLVAYVSLLQVSCCSCIYSRSMYTVHVNTKT